MVQAIGRKRLPFIYFALKGWHTYTRYQHSVFTRKDRQIIKVKTMVLLGKRNENTPCPALDYSFIFLLRDGVKRVKMDILAYTPQAVPSRLGNPTRCHAAGAAWGAPSALLATSCAPSPSELRAPSAACLVIRHGGLCLKPPFKFPLWGKTHRMSPPPLCQAFKLWAEGCATDMLLRDLATQRVAGGVANASNRITVHAHTFHGGELSGPCMAPRFGR
jgi:hypothetical protein